MLPKVQVLANEQIDSIDFVPDPSPDEQEWCRDDAKLERRPTKRLLLDSDLKGFDDRRCGHVGCEFIDLRLHMTTGCACLGFGFGLPEGDGNSLVSAPIYQSQDPLEPWLLLGIWHNRVAKNLDCFVQCSWMKLDGREPCIHRSAPELVLRVSVFLGQCPKNTLLQECISWHRYCQLNEMSLIKMSKCRNERLIADFSESAS